MATASTVTLPSGLTLSCATQGEGPEPALVLLPGPTDSWRSYRPVLERLPSHVRAVALSPRGHGDSDKPATGYRVEDFAADVVPLLDELGIQRPILAGHSGSCLVARRVALDHPDRVAGLVLEASPTTLRGDDGLQDFVSSVVAGLEDPIDAEFARSFVVDTSSEHVAPELLDELVDELLKVPARVWHEAFASLAGYDDTAELEHIAAPTLLLWGDADSLVTREMQDELVSRIPRSELVVYRGVSHTPRWDARDRFTEDVMSFVGSARHD